MSEAIGFIGLGQLGFPMAVNLLEAGHSLRVYNRTAEKAEPLVARGAQSVARPVDAVTSGGVVVTVLWDGAAVESVVGSDGFLERLGAGGLHIAMSTLQPETSQKLAALHARHGCAYVEAPIFGRPEAALARKLWIPMAGPQSAQTRARPLVEAMGAQGIFDLGEAIGAATLLKLVGNFLIISAVRSLNEGLSLVDHKGFDTKAAADMLMQTLFPAPIYQSYGKMIVEKTAAQFSQSQIPVKDLALFETTAALAQSPTPLAHHLLELLRAAQTNR